MRIRIRPLIWLLLPVLILVGVVVAKRTEASSVGALMWDVVTVGNLPPLTGVVSTLGLFGWAVASSLALFTSAVLRRRREQRPVSNFLLGAGVLSLVLYLDDAFLLHDALFPHWFGIPESVTYAVYALLTLFVFVTQRRAVRGLSLPLLGATGAAFFGSILADLFVSDTEMGILLEDGLKFIGITGWAVMLGDLALRTLTEEKRSARDRSPDVPGLPVGARDGEPREALAVAHGTLPRG